MPKLISHARIQFLPFNQIGAIIAMHGALTLANLLYAMPSNTTTDIEEAFAAYKAERMGPSIEFANISKMVAKYMDKSFVGALWLFIVRRLPAWVINISTRRLIRYRPQAGWLPKIENKGTIPAELVPSSEKARAAFEKRHNTVAV